MPSVAAATSSALLAPMHPFGAALLAQAGPGGDEAAAAAAGIAIVSCYCFAIVLGMFATGLWIWMLVDCVSNEPNIPGNNEKLIWILVIVLTGGIGALIYFFVRRPKRKAEHGK